MLREAAKVRESTKKKGGYVRGVEVHLEQCIVKTEHIHDYRIPASSLESIGMNRLQELRMSLV